MPPSPPPHPLAKPLSAEIRVPYRSSGGRVGIGPAFASERPALNDLETQSRRGTIEAGSGRWRDPLGRDGSADAAEVVRFLRSFQTQQEREGGEDLVNVDFGAQKTLRIDSAALASEHRAALTARKSQTFIGARHRGRLARKDAPVAITATARELACLIYTLITRGEEYVERGIKAHEQRRVDRTVSNLGRRVKQLGYQLVRMPEDTDETPGAQPMA